MRKGQLELLVRREAARRTREAEFFIIRLPSAHSFLSRPPAEILLSRECDRYPRNRPEAATQLHRELGPDSEFASENGFYADVVTPELATLPIGWQTRLLSLRFGPATAFCLEVHDLVISKPAAGLLKDFDFASAMVQQGLAKKRQLAQRIGQLSLARDRARLHALFDVLLQNLKEAKRRGAKEPRSTGVQPGTKKYDILRFRV